VKILVDGLDLPESPRYRGGELWFVDGPRVEILGRNGSCRVHATIDCPVLLGLAFTPSGDALVSDSVGRRVWRISSAGEPSVFADLAAETSFMINEPMMMADGSVVVGDIGFDVLGGAEPKAARMIHISPDGRISRTGAPMGFANGLVSTDDGEGLLAAETHGGLIRRYELVAGNGLDGGRIVASIGGDGLDGIALAPDHSIWYADIETGNVGQLSDAGSLLRHLPTGFPHATSCVTNDADTQLFVSVLRRRPTSNLRCDGAIISIAT
jgi:sugar lactone lactonase YvrE